MQELFAPPFQHAFERKQLYYGTYKDKPGKLKISPVRLAMCVFTLFICFIIILMFSTAPATEVDWNRAAQMRFDHIDADAFLPEATKLESHEVKVGKIEFVLSHKSNHFRDEGETRFYAPVTTGRDMITLPSIKETVRIWRRLMLYDEKMLIRLENAGLLCWNAILVEAKVDGVSIPVLRGPNFSTFGVLLLTNEIPIQKHFLIQSGKLQLDLLATKVAAGDTSLFEILVQDVESVVRNGIALDPAVVKYAVERTQDTGIQFRMFFLSATDTTNYRHPGMAFRQYGDTDWRRIGCEKRKWLRLSLRAILLFMLPDEPLKSRRNIMRSVMTKLWTDSTYWGRDQKGPRPIHMFETKKGECNGYMMVNQLDDVEFN